MSAAKTRDRRRFLQESALTLALGSQLLSGCKKTDAPLDLPSAANGDRDRCATKTADRFDFFGVHQAGIVTPQQRFVYFLVADLHSHNPKDARDVFQKWTNASAALMRGDALPASSNPYVPPTDTGETANLGAHGLTLTFGIAPSFLQKLGLQSRAPRRFYTLPAFAREQLQAHLTGGDLCIQSCANDPQVAFHAVRQLVRLARSHITMRWSQAGFVSFDNDSDTPRNLFGFKDGTANRLALADPDRYIWAAKDEPSWFLGGSYLVLRLVRMHLETWDRTSLFGQEETFARHRDTGAPLGATDEFADFDATATDAHAEPLLPDVAHSALAHQSGQRLFRRSFSYSSGVDPRTGQFEAGLLFISFQQSLERFVAIQNALGRVDKMNEYTTHIGSGQFACFGGVRQGEYLGQRLFEG